MAANRYDYNAFLMTWNPAKWDDQGDMSRSAARYAAGQPLNIDAWSSGGRRFGYEKGDRIFLLKQGEGPRGLIGSGWIPEDTGTYEADHWDDSGRVTRYIDIEWEVILPVEDALLIKELTVAAPATWWTLQSSGTRIDPKDVPSVERLWAKHVGRDAPRPWEHNHPATAAGRIQRPRGAGWQQDPQLRKRAEDYAQMLLTKYYEARNWTVTDTRWGNPFDAVATKGTQIRYLEAKAAQGDGTTVQVTAGEVRFAREHPGQCDIGIVSHIDFTGRRLLPSGGDLHVIEGWRPEDDELTPISYKWMRPTETS